MSLKTVFIIISLRFLSNRNMTEIAQFLSGERGRKSEEPGFNIKLIENNKLAEELFNGDKFSLQLKVN